MPTQSLALGTTTLANFNGSAVEQINLNGAGIWTMPVAVATHPLLNAVTPWGWTSGVTNLAGNNNWECNYAMYAGGYELLMVDGYLRLKTEVYQVMDTDGNATGIPVNYHFRQNGVVPSASRPALIMQGKIGGDGTGNLVDTSFGVYEKLTIPANQYGPGYWRHTYLSVKVVANVLHVYNDKYDTSIDHPPPHGSTTTAASIATRMYRNDQTLPTDYTLASSSWYSHTFSTLGPSNMFEDGVAIPIGSGYATTKQYLNYKTYFNLSDGLGQSLVTTWNMAL